MLAVAATKEREARSAIAERVARAREIQAERLARLGEPELGNGVRNRF